ncbi:hypothetical protein T484DRAFT_1828090 [Baffinella frigidus]|nr:hypothetical protein T484DRAFT_1828090 [Cryptophyta sp. CCMP2293]
MPPQNFGQERFEGKIETMLLKSICNMHEVMGYMTRIAEHARAVEDPDKIKEVDAIARSLVLSTKRLEFAKKRLGSVTANNIEEADDRATVGRGGTLGAHNGGLGSDEAVGAERGDEAVGAGTVTATQRQTQLREQRRHRRGSRHARWLGQVIKELKDAKKFGVEEGTKELLTEAHYKTFARKFGDVPEMGSARIQGQVRK